MTTLEQVTGASGVLTPPSYMIYPLLVCREIEKEGGVVSKSRFHEIGKKYGYSPRGLNGFFVGKNAWVVMLADERVALTRKAKERLDGYREWLESQD